MNIVTDGGNLLLVSDQAPKAKQFAQDQPAYHFLAVRFQIDHDDVSGLSTSVAVWRCFTTLLLIFQRF